MDTATNQTYNDFLSDVASEIERLIVDKSVKATFQSQMAKLCQMVEDYGKVEQSCIEELEKAAKQMEAFTPEQCEKTIKQIVERFTPEQKEQFENSLSREWLRQKEEYKRLHKTKKLPNDKVCPKPIRIGLFDFYPPPEGCVKVGCQNNLFINIQTSLFLSADIYRPIEPVNPLLWFEFFGFWGDYKVQRLPDEAEQFMVDCVLLGLIHDRIIYLRSYKRIYDDAVYTPKCRWFKYDNFAETLARECRSEFDRYGESNKGKIKRAFDHVEDNITSTVQSGGDKDKRIKIDLVAFMKSYCDMTDCSDVKKCRDNLYRCKKISLSDAVNYKNPSGHRRQFWVQDLYTNWNTFRDYVPSIPPLKPALELQKHFSTKKST